MKQYGTVIACVRLGSYASLLALIPIGFGTLFFVLGMGELGVGGISVLSLWTLFWLSVLIFGVFDRGILSVGPDGVVWTSGVGGLSMKTRVQVNAWTWSRVVRLRGYRAAVELVGRDGQGHVVYESTFNGSIEARIRQMLAEKAHVSLTRIRVDDERSGASAIEVQNKITVLRDDNGRIVRIIYRPKHYVRGAIVLAAVIAFFALVGWLVWTKGDSPWLIAALVIPAILAVRPGGSSLTLAAQIQGICAFRKPNVVAGVVLLDCKPKLAAHLTPLIERECAIPVFGYLPPMEEAKFASRHLGLVRAQEVPDFQHRIDVIAATLERTCDLEALLAVAAAVEPAPRPGRVAHAQCRIAVARDEAFCFYYDASLARLTECGAELMAFSPLHDKELPPADGLYLGGGYPELHAIQLAENRSMLRSVRDAVVEGLPTVAECGGFMYLQEELVDKSGRAHRMAGVLPGRSYPAGRLVRFGYAHLAARHDSMLLRVGEQVPAHEFHHWDSTYNGEYLVARKLDGTTWKCCHATPTLYAGFPHLHFAGTLPLAERFVQSATKKGRTTQ